MSQSTNALPEFASNPTKDSKQKELTCGDQHTAGDLGERSGEELAVLHKEVDVDSLLVGELVSSFVLLLAYHVLSLLHCLQLLTHLAH